jgi:hypothetical protein
VASEPQSVDPSWSHQTERMAAEPCGSAPQEPLPRDSEAVCRELLIGFSSLSPPHRRLALRLMGALASLAGATGRRSSRFDCFDSVLLCLC